jgi:Domain of unknown function (DUF4412)
MKLKTLVLTFLCSAAPLAAQAFEGSVTMSTYSDNGTAHPISYLIKGGKMRFDVGGGQMSVVLDPTAQRMIVIMNAQKMYMERDFAGAVASVQQQAGVKNPSVVRTGKMDKVAGYKCEHVTITDDDGGAVDSCLSSELGAFRMPAASNPMAPQKESGWITQLGPNNFPLKVSKGGKVVMEVTAIEKKSLDAAMFAPPEGYQSFAMPKRP